MMAGLGRFWTVSNVLSLLRPLLAVWCASVIWTDGPVVWSLGLILAAAVTDILDGALARWTDSVTDWGKVLDPLCDKTAAGILGIILAAKGLLPVWFIGVIVLRDLMIAGGGAWLLKRSGDVQMSNQFGKVTAFVLMVTFIMGLLKADELVMDIFLWSSVLLMTVSLAIYMSRLFTSSRGNGAV